MSEFGPPYWGPNEFDQVEGYPRYPAREMARRFAFADDLVTEHDLDAIVVGGATAPLETSVQFFSNWPSQVQSYIVFPAGSEPTLFVRLWNHLPDAKRISVIADVRYGGDTPSDQAKAVARLLKGRAAAKVGLIGVVPHGDMSDFAKLLPDTDFRDMNRQYQEFRLVKSDDEMTFVRIASRMNDAAVAALADGLRPGINETDIAHIVENTYLGHRGWNLIHFSLSTPMGDPKVFVPHQYHPDRTLADGDVVVTEISTTFWGYAGQILRTFTIGSGPTQRYEQLHAVALDAYESITAALEPGCTVGQVLDAADAITEAGYDIWDDLVHGFGGAYLPPIVRTRASRGATHPDDFVYPDGTLLVVQPNVIDGMAGVQVGNSMWLTESGIEITQEYPTGLVICDR